MVLPLLGMPAPLLLKKAVSFAEPWALTNDPQLLIKINNSTPTLFIAFIALYFDTNITPEYGLCFERLRFVS
jgi:hypothetical protein